MIRSKFIQIPHNELLEALNEALKETSILKLYTPKTKKGKETMEMFIPDLHIGKLCLLSETNNVYNSKEAAARMKRAVSFFINTAPP